MTEVEYGGGGHRTRLRNDHEDQLVCHGVPPAPVYKEQGRRRPALGGGAPRGVLLPPGVGLLLSYLVGVGQGKEGERKKEKGAAPLVQFGLGHGGAHGLP